VLQEQRLDAARDLFAVRFEREMTRVQQMHLDVRQVAVVWGGPFRREDDIVLAPLDQRRRLIRPEEGLEFGVQRPIRPVIVKQIHLDLSILSTIQTT
jgi:hypothetical protein